MREYSPERYEEVSRLLSPRPHLPMCRSPSWRPAEHKKAQTGTGESDTLEFTVFGTRRGAVNYRIITRSSFGIYQFFGSLLAVVPLAIATLIDRWNNHFLIANEAGFFIITVLLMGSGLVFRLKSTTLVGTLGTIVYFLALALFIKFGGLNTVAKIITIGGGTLFGTGLILAFFRDRLLTLPERFKDRKSTRLNSSHRT